MRYPIKFFTFPILLTCLILVSYSAVAQSLVTNPTSNQRQTSPFGWRSSTNSNHLAVDYGASSAGVGGDRINSSHGGTVVESRYQSNGSGGWGNTVLVESSSGNYRTRYSHMADGTRIANGTTINPGDQVGEMGGTGKPGGYAVHLDYAVYVKDPDTGEFHAIDPNEAQGKNLDDPETRRQLIEDAKEKVRGDLRSEGDPQGGNSDTSGSGGGSAGGSDAAVIGCDPAIKQTNKAKKEALQQMETEAAKALITKPTSVMQLTCFEQYTKKVHENIGKIHSKPAEGISGTIVPNVEIPAINFTMDNFLSSVMSGGLQSMMNNALSSLTGGLGGGGGDNCNAMDEMWKILECIDFPKMPGLSDILGGGGDLGGILSGLGGGAGGLGSLGGGAGGGGIMGAVCQAASSLFGGGSGGSGGGSGSTDVYENLLNDLNQESENNDDIYSAENVADLNDKVQQTSSGENLCLPSNWVYPNSEIARLDVLNNNGELDTSEFVLFDTDGNCAISAEEIAAYEQNLTFSNEP